MSAIDLYILAMDCVCNDLLTVIFQFTPPEDRIRFIKMGQKYLDVACNYIISPEWVHYQIDQFIERCAIGYHLRNDFQVDYAPPVSQEDTPEYELAISEDFTKQILSQLEIKVMRVSYKYTNFAACDMCDCISTCECDMHTLILDSSYLNVICRAPFDNSFLDSSNNGSRIRLIVEHLAEHPEAEYCAYWVDRGDHIRDVAVDEGDIECDYIRNFHSCEYNNPIAPVRTVYESIGIIVHNMTGVEQIHTKLIDYDISHLQMFYLVDYIMSRKLRGLPGAMGDRDAKRYDLFVESVLQNHIRTDVAALIELNQCNIPACTFVIHPEIDFKAVEVAKFYMIFTLE